jgi:hypothetical protein
MEGDKHDREEGNIAQGVVSPGRRRIPQGRGRIALEQALNLKSCHISSLEEDKYERSKSSPMHNFLMQPYLHTNYKRTEKFRQCTKTK